MAERAYTELQFGGSVDSVQARELAELVAEMWNPDELVLPDGATWEDVDTDAPGVGARAELVLHAIHCSARAGLAVTMRGEVSGGCLGEITRWLAARGLPYRTHISPTDYDDGERAAWRPGDEQPLAMPGGHGGGPMVSLDWLEGELAQGRSLRSVVVGLSVLAEDCPAIVVTSPEPLRRVFIHRQSLLCYVVWLDPASGAILRSAGPLERPVMETAQALDPDPSDHFLDWLRAEDAEGRLGDVTNALVGEGREVGGAFTVDV